MKPRTKLIVMILILGIIFIFLVDIQANSETYGGDRRDKRIIDEVYYIAQI